jgi:hypothetical protein
VANLAQPLLERAYEARLSVRRVAADEPNHRHRRLLRARHKRQRGSGAAQKRNELTPLHIRSQGQETVLYRLKRALG